MLITRETFCVHFMKCDMHHTYQQRELCSVPFHYSVSRKCSDETHLSLTGSTTSQAILTAADERTKEKGKVRSIHNSCEWPRCLYPFLWPLNLKWVRGHYCETLDRCENWVPTISLSQVFLGAYSIVKTNGFQTRGVPSSRASGGYKRCVKASAQKKMFNKNNEIIPRTCKRPHVCITKFIRCNTSREMFS